jgi:hypothetical protein
MRESDQIPHQSLVSLLTTYQKAQKEITTSFILQHQAKQYLNHQARIIKQVLK